MMWSNWNHIIDVFAVHKWRIQGVRLTPHDTVGCTLTLEAAVVTVVLKNSDAKLTLHLLHYNSLNKGFPLRRIVRVQRNFGGKSATAVCVRIVV